MQEEKDIFYDRYGKPILRFLVDNRLVGFNGVNYFFVLEDAIYAYNGVHIGWLEGGIIRDLDGKVLAFGEFPVDSPKPFLPFKQFKPYKEFVMYEPHRPHLQLKKHKPFKSFSWSHYHLTQRDDDK